MNDGCGYERYTGLTPLFPPAFFYQGFGIGYRPIKADAL